MPRTIDWEGAVRRALGSMGGEASLKDIYAWMRANVPLTEAHLQPSLYKEAPKYHTIVRRYASEMVADGKLEQPARGRFKLMD